MIRDSYRSITREQIEFVRTIKDGTHYTSICHNFSECIKLILLLLLEEYGQTTPWHFTVTNLYVHCNIYIPNFNLEIEVSELDAYQNTCTLGSPLFTEYDVRNCIDVTNRLIEYVNTLLYAKGAPLLKEI